MIPLLSFYNHPREDTENIPEDLPYHLARSAGMGESEALEACLEDIPRGPLVPFKLELWSDKDYTRFARFINPFEEPEIWTRDALEKAWNHLQALWGNDPMQTVLGRGYPTPDYPNRLSPPQVYLVCSNIQGMPLQTTLDVLHPVARMFLRFRGCKILQDACNLILGPQGPKSVNAMQDLTGLLDMMIRTMSVPDDPLQVPLTDIVQPILDFTQRTLDALDQLDPWLMSEGSEGSDDSGDFMDSEDLGNTGGDAFWPGCLTPVYEEKPAKSHLNQILSFGPPGGPYHWIDLEELTHLWKTHLYRHPWDHHNFTEEELEDLRGLLEDLGQEYPLGTV